MNSPNTSRTADWVNEIRQYMLGRWSKQARTEALDDTATTDPSLRPPILQWWIFEGKRYSPLNGTLVGNWGLAMTKVKQAFQTFNMRRRIQDRLEGDVDWGQTLARGFFGPQREYVVRSSAIGLDDRERQALYGWLSWIRQQWAEYAKLLGNKDDIDWPFLEFEMPLPDEVDGFLRRWAYTARRSRWPLLHGLVAETLRPFIEPEELDRIPLPEEEATLFELFCLVRIARYSAPKPKELRWLNSGTDNEIKLEGLRMLYQKHLDTEDVLSSFSDSQLSRAMSLFGVRIPQFVDIAVQYDVRRAGFDGIIVEAKSGKQDYYSTVAQLRAYKKAYPRQPGTRYLIWGIVEAPPKENLKLTELRQHILSADQSEDVWVFSSEKDIETVLEAAGLNVQASSTLRPGATTPAIIAPERADYPADESYRILVGPPQ